MRLVNPGSGVVVSVDGDTAARLRAQGWVDADSRDSEVEVPPVEPPKRRGRPRKTIEE